MDQPNQSQRDGIAYAITQKAIEEYKLDVTRIEIPVGCVAIIDTASENVVVIRFPDNPTDEEVGRNIRDFIRRHR